MAGSSDKSKRAGAETGAGNTKSPNDVKGSKRGSGAKGSKSASGPPRQWSTRVSGELLERLAKRAACGAPREALVVEAPLTGETLGEVPQGTADDIVAAARRAREVQPAWAATPVAERAAILLRFHDLLIANVHEILDLIQLESGKARVHALEEALDIAIQARYYAHTVEGLLRSRRRQGALPVLTSAREYRHPKGVVGFISPWNYPFIFSVGDAIPALAAGNAVIVKPDAQTPFCSLWAQSLLDEAGLPAGLVQIVTGRGSELGGPLIANVDAVLFTGSTETGRVVAQQAAAQLIDFSAELGGKNPMLVLADASLRRAVPGTVRGVCSNSGELCISLERIYVHDSIYDEYVSRVVEAFAALTLGAGLDFDADMGSLVSADMLAKVSGHVDDAVAKGARVLVGGRARPDLGPYFYEPTLLEGVTEEMELCRNETFGPVAALYRFDDLDQAVAAANDSDYGLNASIWTRDVAAGRRLAQRLQTGTVNINEAYAASWASASPMGGFKQSGVGRRHGEAGLLKYTEAQSVVVQRLLPIGTWPFLDHQQYAQVMTLGMKVLKHLPGVK